ncbi:hypothetical protein U1769_00840 [Sphingomonas sp. ZT3P38]|uniref:hypothetical protein n=1 Tax=Parasphingomonas zepuensis TaxID=3096161 RepID=UPI002FC99B94
MELYDGQEPDGFDWSEALCNAGVPPRFVDLSHLTLEEQRARHEAREQAAIAVATTIGLPIEADSQGRPVLAPPVPIDLQREIDAVPIAKAHLDWVARVVSAIPEDMRYAGVFSAYSANECVEEHGLKAPLAGAALAARAVALCRWRDAHDPQQAAYQGAVLEAAARTPVVYTDGLPGFDPAVFGELVEFLTDMPY